MAVSALHRLRLVMGLAFAAVAAAYLAGEGRCRPSAREALPRQAGEIRVDLNTATDGELTVLPGVGPATAEAIVAERAARGPFASPEDLRRVKGVGPAKIRRIGPWVEAR